MRRELKTVYEGHQIEVVMKRGITVAGVLKATLKVDGKVVDDFSGIQGDAPQAFLAALVDGVFIKVNIAISNVTIFANGNQIA